MHQTMNTQRTSLFRSATLVWAGLVAGIVLGSTLTIAGQADAGEPYGGCKEAWQAPRSAGADDCRALGYTVRRHIVVGPKRWVLYSSLPSCRFEDASSGPIPCSWNFRSTDGNGRGDAYWVTGTHRHPVFHHVRGVR